MLLMFILFMYLVYATFQVSLCDVHLYILLSIVMLRFMHVHMFISCRVYVPCYDTRILLSSSRHHLASILSQPVPVKGGFRKFMDQLQFRLCYGGGLAPQVHDGILGTYAS